jgi:hypothetical protein
VWRLSMAAALQTIQLPGNVAESGVEFGDFAATAAVSNCRNDYGWQADYYPSQQKQRYIFHLFCLGK